MPSIEQLVRSIDRRIRELRGEIASLEDARAALVSSGSPQTPSHKARTTPVRQKPPPRTRRRKRTTKKAALPAETAEQLLAENNGLTTTALATQSGADRDQVLTLLRDLETARLVRRTGHRRGTRWYAITDEDRIQERASELASRSRRRGK